MGQITNTLNKPLTRCESNFLAQEMRISSHQAALTHCNPNVMLGAAFLHTALGVAGKGSPAPGSLTVLCGILPIQPQILPGLGPCVLQIAQIPCSPRTPGIQTPPRQSQRHFGCLSRTLSHNMDRRCMTTVLGGLHGDLEAPSGQIFVSNVA